MKTSRYTAPLECPYCGFVSIAATGLVDDVPGAGDYAVCVECQDLVVYALDEEGLLTMRPASEAELLAIPLEQLSAIQAMVDEYTNRASMSSR